VFGGDTDHGTKNDLSPPSVSLFMLSNKLKIIMKRSNLLLLLSILFFNKSNGQITRDNWMVGGNANFLFNRSNTGFTDTKTTTINLAPNIGYFFVDKLAGGIRLSFYKNQIKFGPPNNNFTTFTVYSAGPFIRYYFLPVDKQYNILTEINYQFGNEKIESNNSSSSTSNNSNSFSFSAGPVIYFNSSVGIEFLLNYSSTGNNLSSKRANSIGIGIGLQVHLQKDKN
jgi:hypothetical protein